jgi:tRNA nucleotidyltransferase (CCA-adding enzyme)
MSREHVDHSDIVRFAEDRVNLGREDAAELRAQARRLRERLEAYLEGHPDFELKKMLLSGSLAKGTALATASDIDLAAYVSSESAPHTIRELIDWLAKKLETAFPNFKPEQITRQTYSVTVSFKGTGNDVDIVPILYSGDPAWRGDLISQETGEKLMTSVPMHLEFIRRRKAEHDRDYTQVVRLLKFWASLKKQTDEGFRCKSFMLELIVAYLADHGTPLDDYPEAMAVVFNFIACDAFQTVVAFDDYYDPSVCTATMAPIRIWDPVNCENNVAKQYTAEHRSKLVAAAMDAGDAIDSALHAVTKADTLRYWRKVFGPTFSC